MFCTVKDLDSVMRSPPRFKPRREPQKPVKYCLTPVPCSVSVMDLPLLPDLHLILRAAMALLRYLTRSLPDQKRLIILWRCRYLLDSETVSFRLSAPIYKLALFLTNPDRF